MALTDVAIRQAKPAAKQYKLADGAGLYLLVTPAGGKLWRLKYRMAGKEKLAAFGAYPDVSLAEARKRRDEAREQIAASKDPSRAPPSARRVMPPWPTSAATAPDVTAAKNRVTAWAGVMARAVTAPKR